MPLLFSPTRLAFQFTHPGRGATHYKRGNRLYFRVSIHAPREGCDGEAYEIIMPFLKFQFTHPGRGATEIARLLQEWEVVSIHAPREGCDT